MNSAIQTEWLAYDNGHFSLAELDVHIPHGRITAIVGPNGSGKSTLLRLMAGLLKPDGGDIIIDGRAAAAYSRTDYAKKLAMLPQSKDMTPDLTVKELVAYGRSPHQRAFRHRLTSDDNAIIDWALGCMRIRSYEHRPFHSLSGGEQQKARIAMALAQKTGILLLDEPTTYLDIAHQLELLTMLAKLNRDHGITIVMVLHDLQQSAAFCHHLIAMREGEQFASGDPKELLTPKFMRDVFHIHAKVSFADQYPIIVPIIQEEDEKMIIVTNTSQITKGDGEKLIERFDRIGKVEGMEGFLGLEVLFTQNLKEYDEVSIVTRWNSKEDFQNWTRSEAFRESHSGRKTPDYIISNKITFQEVKIRRNPLPPSETAEPIAQ
ncbi:heme oxygenase [Paenibacillus sp. NPDC057967]|uniref:heme oxygenase n=1 Tax=Paenibacillus sp. NPDC057967 TaxID=3346293 RepID=UPI0036DAE473